MKTKTLLSSLPPVKSSPATRPRARISWAEGPATLESEPRHEVEEAHRAGRRTAVVTFPKLRVRRVGDRIVVGGVVEQVLDVEPGLERAPPAEPEVARRRSC